MKELLRIQQELHAPKTQHNSFGKYNYRSCEDILLEVKPLLEKYECVLLMSDKIKELANPYTLHTSKTDRDGQESLEYAGTRVYVEATATIINKEGLSISVTASAREEVVKKGMDAAQITGATSSYARKYALNGLLCIDDNKDYDTNECHEEVKSNASKNNKPTSQSVPAPDAPKVIPAPKGWTKDEVKKRIFASNTTGELMSIHMTYGDDQEISSLLTERKHQILKANGTQ